MARALAFTPRERGPWEDLGQKDVVCLALNRILLAAMSGTDYKEQGQTETVSREATAIVQAGDIQWLGPGRFGAVGSGRDQMWDVSEGSDDGIC